jgi:pSer/pThr/pTyr-binding forkhead associated (FHA) protein
LLKFHSPDRHGNIVDYTTVQGSRKMAPRPANFAPALFLSYSLLSPYTEHATEQVMGSKHDEVVDTSQPALILVHGNSVRRHRSLARDATSIGRAHGCDICLEAPDVSGLHCIITRRGAELHVRDCSSRSGTHLNGDAIREPAMLQEGDILQFGPFSFRVHSPAALAGSAPQEQRAERSRRNLARIALALRQRLQQLQSEEPGRELEEKEAELAQQAIALDECAQKYEQRLAQLEQAERELGREREAFQREALEWETRRTQQPEEDGACPTQFQDVTRGLEAMQLEHQEIMKAREDWGKEQAEATGRLEQQRAALVQAEASLREQRAGLSRMMVELKQLQDAIRSQQNTDLENLRRENEQLHQLLAERDQQRVEAAPASSGEADSIQELRAEINLLRQLLQEKDALLEELRQQPSEPATAPISDIGAYEAELTEFKRQLEEDRKKLNAEIEHLRARNQEMDDATREMELELSRERAELARERQRLDRIREETRLELDKMQREAGVRDRLAPVFKLREQISGGSSGQG